jgi:hypothetical protein
MFSDDTPELEDSTTEIAQEFSARAMQSITSLCGRNGTRDKVAVD